MREDLVRKLRGRNSRIIAAVIRKSEMVCPGSVALIGIAGSFHSGDIHERSDLDLCIVTNDDDGSRVASCFILGQVAHDIYCTPWQRLSAMSEYTDPYVTKLLELDIVYCLDDRSESRYLALRDKVKAKLASPFSDEDMQKVTIHLENAMKEYARVVLSDDAADCKYASARMLCSIEYVIYMANKSYVKRGIRRIPEELEAMRKLPDGFMRCFDGLVVADSVDEIKSCSTALMGTTREFAVELSTGLDVKKDITPQAIDGTYEEIFSNWRSKMHYAAENDDAYLSFMTAASCQDFYHEMADEFAIEPIRLFDGFRVGDLSGSAEEFDSAMERYKDLYSRCGKPVRHYPSINAFEKDYLR
jgi:hypothetical protein